MNLLLMGLRGSGKSTLGPRLAAASGREFVDLDALTARVLGAPSAGEALRTRGEPDFRRAEACAIRVACDGDRRVIALGGGTPTAPGVAGFLRRLSASRDAHLCYLRADVATLRKRLESSTQSRPSLTGADPLDEIATVHAARDPLYRELSDSVIDVDGRAEDEVLGLLLAATGGHRSG